MNSKGDTEGADPANNVPVSHEPNQKCVRRISAVSILLRLTAAPLCAVAMILMITNKETHNFVIPMTPPIVVPKTAKYTGVRALKFFVYINGIVAGYNFLHALFSMITSLKGPYRRSRPALWLTFLLDQMMVYTLISAAATTAEVAYIADKGNPASQWVEVCSKYGAFCDRVGICLIICFIGILLLIALSAISAYQLFSTASRRHYGGDSTTTIAAPKNFGSR